MTLKVKKITYEESLLSKVKTIRELADEAGLDYDLALVTLWDAGYESLGDIDDTIPVRDMSGACSTLGVVTAKKMQCLAYWVQAWEVTEQEARERLLKYGISVSPDARMLPKGALKKLRRSGVFSPVLTSPTPTSSNQAGEPEFIWQTVGREREPELLSSADIRRIHDALVEDFRVSKDPIDPPGVRDNNLLESAAFRPGTSLGGERKYSTVELAGAALLHSIIHNHPFHNGNKRTALVSVLAFLDRNNVLLTCTESDLFKLVLKVAQHRLAPIGWSSVADREVQEIARWVLKNSRQIQHGDRLLKWRELRRILSRFDCRISSPMPGNRIKVQRTVQAKGLFGLSKMRTYGATVGYRSDGHEVDATLLKHLRKELQLDDEHGVDSAYFYGSDHREPDEFITQYRTLLKRLAKL
ncbi:type II toxin-antitoxin system death-on-curing family toxin [Streptomyces sp. NPDC005538]|uniref:type II toxin-antitoxin system death-on-curing family toxin n=1 Tax=unclassified Streptomyces TaxID=2593676 RepID=UPI0033A0E3C5